MSGRFDLTARVRDLVADLVADRDAVAGPSCYETGRLVTLAPWLDGHARRIRFLLDSRHRDGTWGGPGRYAVVPTLSAVEALLRVPARGGAAGATGATGAVAASGTAAGALRAAAERGLRAVAPRPGDLASGDLPPTAGAGMIIAALAADINDHLGERRLVPPAAGEAALARLRGGGWRVPLLAHYLELVGEGVAGVSAVRPVDGVVCGSAAATAAWLGPVAPPAGGAGDAARRSAAHALAGLQARHGGPVPAFTSQVHVAQAWSLAHLALAGVGGAVLAGLRDVIARALDRPAARAAGLPGAPGLPADSDTTAVALFALARLGVVRDPEPLWSYDTGEHFVTVRPESEASTAANAHILMALGEHAARGGPAARRCAAAAARIAAWLRDRRRGDGSWLDKWHASPYYATRSCAVALHRYGGPAHADVVDGAVRWTLATQRADGSWGVQGATAEETAYAVQTLLHCGGRAGPRAAPGAGPGTTTTAAAGRAAARGCRYLIEHQAWTARHPPLFHGKDLVAIPNLSRAAVLAALELARRTPAAGGSA
jgi:halimadienyl-diphosphate synthase